MATLLSPCNVIPQMDALEQQQYWEQTLKTPRYADEKRLSRYGAKAYSQADEDGIIAEIFRRIGIGNHSFIEIGVGPGLENNTLALLLSGWRGMWVDANEADVATARSRLAEYVGSSRLRIEHEFITRGNVDPLLAGAGFDNDVDLLSIDVDGNDYWIWEAVRSINPRVVIVEYNATWFPPLTLTIVYQENFRWHGSNYFGTSLKALELLAERKGYHLVGCSFSGVNAFFVRADLCGSKFHAPYTAENHFEPPRYWMCRPSGHPPGIGPVEIIS
jgi:hypothetical protein